MPGKACAPCRVEQNEFGTEDRFVANIENFYGPANALQVRLLACRKRQVGKSGRKALA